MVLLDLYDLFLGGFWGGVGLSIISVILFCIFFVDIMTAIFITHASHGTISSFWRYFFASVLLTPIFAVSLAIMEAVCLQKQALMKSTSASSSKPAAAPAQKAAPRHVLIVRGSQRQVVLETEVERYVREGWTVMD